eukprot:TRINITY_DN14493_c0_g1_i1.p1 TRINITY_DN14493_c0_g1~~TRINITY_DN14493_c0_g1_i1.p1  ORF type:complete len:438 (+),score=41.58 TRINITY_DN14493_c0_g1_i1:117-1316(+)
MKHIRWSARYKPAIGGEAKHTARRAVNDAKAAEEISEIVPKSLRGVDEKMKRRVVRDVYFKIEELKSRGAAVGVRSYSSAIRVFARVKAVDHAVVIWERMAREGLKPDGGCYSAVLGALGQHPETFERFKEVWRSMRSEGIKPTTVNYNTLIHVYSLQGDVKGCFSVAKAMGLDSVKKNSYTYGILLNAVRNAKQRRAVIDDMVADGVTPDTDVMNAAIKGCQESVSEPWKIFELLTHLRATPTIDTYNTLISTYKQHSAESYALSLIKYIDLPYDHYTYNLLLSCCLELTKTPGDPPHLLSNRLLSAATARGSCTPRTTLIAIQIHAKHNLLDDCLKIYRNADPGPNTDKQMLSTIAEVCKRNGAAVPRHLLSKMRGVGIELPGGEDSSGTEDPPGIT